MLKLEIHCETTEVARMYVNAESYFNLIQDFAQQMRLQRKHDQEGGELRLFNQFYDDFQRAACIEGPY